MISTGPNGGGSKTTSNFFMANIWSGSASNIAAAAAASVSSSSSRAFQHSRLLTKSGSEESLNSVLLQDEQKNSLERGGKELKVKRNVKQIRKRARSQNDAADTVSEHDFVVSPDHLKNNTCNLREHESGEVIEDEDDGDEEDGSITETSKSKCDTPVKITRRIADMKKSERSKQKELIAAILDDTDDLDQLEYFDDNEIYSSSTPPSMFSYSSSSSTSSPVPPAVDEQAGVQQTKEKSTGKQTPKSSENVAFELFRALSIKSTNMWWRWSGNKGSKDNSVEENTTPTVTGSDLLEQELNSMNRANSVEQTPANSSKNENTIMSKLKNFARLSEEKEKMEKFTFYSDEPDQKPNLMLFKGCNEIYKVKSSEETLRSIAAKYKTTPAEIKSLNHLSQDHIFIGQLLLIPLMVETEQNSNDKSATYY